MPALTLPELRLLAIYWREEERAQGSHMSVTEALTELNTSAGIVFEHGRER